MSNWNEADHPRDENLCEYYADLDKTLKQVDYVAIINYLFFQ